MKNDGFVAKYKKTYTIEDANELKEWIAKTKPTGSFDMGHGIKVKNAADYCESILEVFIEGFSHIWNHRPIDVCCTYTSKLL